MASRQRFARWLFRLGPDERLPVVPTRRRIFILPTGAGRLHGVAPCVALHRPRLADGNGHARSEDIAGLIRSVSVT